MIGYFAKYTGKEKQFVKLTPIDNQFPKSNPFCWDRCQRPNNINKLIGHTGKNGTKPPLLY